MKPDAYLQAVSQMLTNDGNSVATVQLPSFNAVIGYQSSFKWRWLATKLHLFTVAVYIPELNASLYAQAIHEAADYAIKMKGKMRGFQSGVAVTVIIATQAVDTETITISSSRPAKGFAKLTTPVVVDLLQAKTYMYTGKVVWGAVYTAWLRQRMAACMPAIQPRQLSEEELSELY